MGDSNHSCSEIVRSQRAAAWNAFQVPEPWSGHLEEAPILFFSSNPSISTHEAYPNGAGNPERSLQDFFDSRFDGHWVKEGNKALNADLITYGPAVNYWSCIRNRAEELLGRKTIAGVDYALSEIVHCKSRGELGVKTALLTCARRYMMDLLTCSGAVVLVLVGRKVLRHWNSLQSEGLPTVQPPGVTRLQIGERECVAVYLAAPGSAEPKLFNHWLGEEKIKEIRTLIAGRNK